MIQFDAVPKRTLHALADRPPLTRRTPRLYQRAFRRRNTQHSRIYAGLGLMAPIDTVCIYIDDQRRLAKG